MYVTEEVPILDDPANTTAVYRKEGPLSRDLDKELRLPGSRESSRPPPGEGRSAGGPPRTSPSTRGSVRGVDMVLAGLGAVEESCRDEAGSLGGMTGSTALALMEVGGTKTPTPPGKAARPAATDRSPGLGGRTGVQASPQPPQQTLIAGRDGGTEAPCGGSKGE